jgi:hypothetical protein
MCSVLHAVVRLKVVSCDGKTHLKWAIFGISLLLFFASALTWS